MSFELREAGAWGDLDGVVAIGVPADELPCPGLVLGSGRPPSPGAEVQVDLASSALLDRRLRGQRLVEASPPAGSLPTTHGEQVLASIDGRPVWVARRGGPQPLQVAAAAAPRLGDDEPLRTQLCAGRFLALLPLAHFLRELTADSGWCPPPLRAHLMFDDPNIRWRTYGHIDYAQMEAHAQEHGYHASMAMIPSDWRLAHAPTRRRFAKSRALSLMMHGLVHENRELAATPPAPVRLAAVARAMNQVAGFERRTGVTVSRVMCPPHGQASAEYLSTLGQLGLEAFTACNPNPWLPEESPSTGSPLLGWRAADFVSGALPLMTRRHMCERLDDLVLKAFLDQPLFLYGHHWDLSDGLDRLAHVAEFVNRLGDVHWCAAHELVRGTFLQRQECETLALRPLARKLEVAVPAGTAELRLELPPMPTVADALVTVGDAPARQIHTRGGHATLVTGVEPGLLNVSIEAVDRLDVASVRGGRLRPWPAARRAMTEVRDRLQPLVA